MKLALFFFLMTTIFCDLSDSYEWNKVEVPEYETLTTAFQNQSINRPLFHFTPQFGWMNDPNGMWIDSTKNPIIYHLYFQYNPKNTFWGMPLDWGHATSTNLLEWTELKPAFGPNDGRSGAYSGSMFIDDENMSKMFTDDNTNNGKLNLIAAYTFNDDQWKETQYLYFSKDGNEFFNTTSFPNPVVSHKDPTFETQFRDPQVVKFYIDDSTNGYLMSVAKSQEYKIAFYLSKTDLKQGTWEEQINLELEGFLGYQYECPNLAHLKNNDKVDGKYNEEDSSYWVLFISINPGSIQGGSSTWYLFGQFELKNEEGKYYFNPKTKYPAPLDYGKDFYAMQLFYQYKDNSELKSGSDYGYGIAWASNWQYTGSVPTDPWRSSMSLPRKISIGHFQSSPETAILYIKSEPYFIINDSITKLEIPDLKETFNGILNVANPSTSFSIESDSTKVQGSIFFEITITVLDTEEFLNSNPGHLDFYFKGSSDNSEYLRFGYEQKATAFYVDRSHSNVPWVFENPYFSDKISLNVMPYQTFEGEENQVQYFVKGYIDRNIIELFFNEGYQTTTNTFFFTGGNFINDVDIKVDYGEKGFKVEMKAAQIYEKQENS